MIIYHYLIECTFFEQKCTEEKWIYSPTSLFFVKHTCNSAKFSRFELMSSTQKNSH